MKKPIYALLRSMGVTSKYKGYFYFAEAVKLSLELIEKQNKTINITKDIYPAISSKYKAKIENIEHNIRTIVTICWENDRSKVEKLAGLSLEIKPTNRQFLDMVTYYFWNKQFLDL